MKLALLIVAILGSSCTKLEPDKYFTRFFQASKDRNDLLVATSTVEACQKANPGVSAARCHPHTCFSNPFTMKGNQWMLEDVGLILNELKIPFWLDGGSLIAQLRFGAMMPWDDDVDLSTMEDDFLPKLGDFRKATALLGYDLRVQHTLPTISEVSAVLVVYSEAKFRQMALKVAALYEFDISLPEINELWLAYNFGEPFPRLDVEMMRKMGPEGNITFVNTLFQHQSMKASDIYPLATACMLGKRYTVPKNIEAYLFAEYKAANIDTDWVMSSEHNPKCTQSIRLKNSQEFPGWITVTNAYLKSIYGAQFNPKSDDC